MVWWQIILILLLGILPCMLVAFALCMAIVETKNTFNYSGEVLSSLKGLHTILARIEKKVKGADMKEFGE